MGESWQKVAQPRVYGYANVFSSDWPNLLHFKGWIMVPAHQSLAQFSRTWPSYMRPSHLFIIGPMLRDEEKDNYDRSFGKRAFELAVSKRAGITNT